MSPATRQLTREWFRDNALACIAEAEAGEVRVNDLPEYRMHRLASAAEFMAGKWDHTFTFQQRAEYIETGVCRPLLP